MIRLSVVLALAFLIVLPVSAESVMSREGWRVIPTEQSYSELLASTRQAVTEEEDGTATLSWKTPSHVFAPYLESGGAELKVVAEELDGIFEAIGSTATER